MITPYPQPRSGRYTYRRRNFDGSFTVFYTSVLVLGESEKSYKVKITVSLGNHPAGDTLKVRKRNVSFGSTEPRTHDYSDAYWNR